MRRQKTALITLLASAVLAACGGESEEAASGPSLPPGTEPVGAETRPATILEAVAGESHVPLFRIADEDTAVYVLGTTHLMIEGLDWRRREIDAAFARAEAVYLEADIFSKAAQRAMGVIVSRAAELEESESLAGFYEAEELEALSGYMKAIGQDLEAFGGYRPWFASMQAERSARAAAGGAPEADADVVIARETMRRGVPLRYLETAAQQVAAMAAGKDERDAVYLLHRMANLSKGQAYFADLMAAWHEGDLERLDLLLNLPLEVYPERKERVLRDRNIDWSQQIDRLLTDEPGTYMVVVGVEHLVGDVSLLEQMKRRGYEAVRL